MDDDYNVYASESDAIRRAGALRFTPEKDRLQWLVKQLLAMNHALALEVMAERKATVK